MKNIRLTTYIISLMIFYNCSPKLNPYEIEVKINEKNTAHFEGNIDYMIKNLPVKELKAYGEDGVKSKLSKVFNSNRKYPISYRDIGELKVLSNGKCGSYPYYNITYRVTKVRMTQYMDSTALALNYKNYGRENVTYNPNSKILHVTEYNEAILIFDKDKNWKVLGFDKNYIKLIYGKEFANCVESSFNAEQ